MNTQSFRGLWTALVTPFVDGNGLDNAIDYEALTRLLHAQIEAGVDGVLLLGTTAENPTLTQQESFQLVSFALSLLKGKTKVMVNIGTYCTRSSLENLSLFETLDGIDAYLIVNPYYNKPTQTGLSLHFCTLANATTKPVVLYNILSRTGVNLETKTMLDILSKAPNVIGVKEASGNRSQMQEVLASTPDEFLVFSGDDALTYDLATYGGDGVISVASNGIPATMKRFVDACLSNTPSAHDQNESLKPLFGALFLQTNPLPIKTFLADKGVIQESFRLPLCPMDLDKKQIFLEEIAGFQDLT